MTISIGDRLPDATFFVMGDDGPEKKTTGDIFGGKTVVLFGLPGAFTPTCHKNHLPGFIEHSDRIKAKGVDDIAVVCVQDAFVMNAWKEASNADGKVRFLGDGNAEFTKAIGMEMDGSSAGMGTRSKRYSMIVEDGVVRALNEEDTVKSAETSGAANILKQLDQVAA